MPNEPLIASRHERRAEKSICDDAQTLRVSSENIGHESVRVPEAGRRTQIGPNTLDALRTTGDSKPRCMAGARGKAPAVVQS